LLQGCGNNSSSGLSQNTVRLVNGSSNALDMATGGMTLASGVAYGTASGNVTLNTGSYVIELEDTGTGIPSAQINFSFSSGAPSTLLAFTSSHKPADRTACRWRARARPGRWKIRISRLVG